MPRKHTHHYSRLEHLSVKITDWMGTPQSVVAHTLLFGMTFLLVLLGISPDRVMLALTTAVSLEAIYLSLFIQMTVNRHSKSLKEVEKDIDEIQEDVEDVSEDIQEDDMQDMNLNNSLVMIEKQMKMLSENVNKVNEEILTLHKNAKPVEQKAT